MTAAFTMPSHDKARVALGLIARRDPTAEAILAARDPHVFRHSGTGATL